MFVGANICLVLQMDVDKNKSVRQLVCKINLCSINAVLPVDLKCMYPVTLFCKLNIYKSYFIVSNLQANKEKETLLLLLIRIF